MKKRYLALLLAALMTASLGAALPGDAALAEGRKERIVSLPEHPVNPAPPPTIVVEPPTRAAKPFTIECTQEPALGVQGSWTVTPNEGVEVAQYRFLMCIVSHVENGSTYLETLWKGNPSENTFSYTCHQVNTYYLYVYGLDEYGQEILNEQGQVKYRQYVSFGIEDDPEAETLDSRVQALAAQCLGEVSGDYEIALWLHDWITGHAYYDYSLQRYGAEDILFGGGDPDEGISIGGPGVCDSYSKLYEKLLQACGLESVRFTGGDHSWNAVNIGGSWCHIDTTWDDLGETTLLASGLETHDYFGINDEIALLDHVFTPGELCACDTLEYCYVYLHGTYHMWMFFALEDMDLKLAVGQHDFDAETQNKMVVRITDEEVIVVQGGQAIRYLNMGTALLNLENSEWTLCGRVAFPASFVYSSLTGYVHVTLDIDLAALDGYALTLIPGVIQIEESAFEGTCAYMKVILDDQIESVESRAFADCAWLAGAVIPPSCVSIAEDAFDGVPAGMIIACESGSYAEEYALAHGYAVQYTDVTTGPGEGEEEEEELPPDP